MVQQNNKWGIINLKEEIIITAIVILLFLLNLRASIVVAITLPIAVLIAFISMYFFNIDANIMSLAGIAIAIGTMVDMSIIVSEAIYSHLADWEDKGRPGGKSGSCYAVARPARCRSGRRWALLP